MEDVKVVKLKEIENMLNELKPKRRNTKEVQEDKLQQKEGTRTVMVEKLNRAKLPKKDEAKAASLPELTKLEHIKLIPVGKSVVYYYGMSLPKMRAFDKKLDAIASEFLLRSTVQSTSRGDADVKNALSSGTGEFELKQEAVQDVERFPSGALMDVTKYYYIAKRVK